MELNGSAIGIKAQFWKEDSEAIVELSLDKMNKVFCPEKNDENSENFAQAVCAEDWAKQNEQRKLAVAEMRKLKLEIQIQKYDFFLNFNFLVLKKLLFFFSARFVRIFFNSVFCFHSCDFSSFL